jgi:hypothetical protein
VGWRSIAPVVLAFAVGACSLDLSVLPRRDAGDPIDARSPVDAPPPADAAVEDAAADGGSEPADAFVERDAPTGCAAACDPAAATGCGTAEHCHAAEDGTLPTCGPSGAQRAWFGCADRHACMAALQCIDGACRPACAVPSDCRAREGDGSWCLQRPGIACTGYCTRDCQPQTGTPCAGAYTCRLVTLPDPGPIAAAYTDCAPVGVGADGDACVSDLDCGALMACAAPSVSEPTVCMRICRFPPDCAGALCDVRFDVRGTQYGVCVNAP